MFRPWTSRFFKLRKYIFIDRYLHLDQILEKRLNSTSTKYSKSRESSRRRLFIRFHIIFLHRFSFRIIHNHQSIGTIHMVISRSFKCSRLFSKHIEYNHSYFIFSFLVNRFPFNALRSIGKST